MSGLAPLKPCGICDICICDQSSIYVGLATWSDPSLESVAVLMRSPYPDKGVLWVNPEAGVGGTDERASWGAGV